MKNKLIYANLLLAACLVACGGGTPSEEAPAPSDETPTQSTDTPAPSDETPAPSEEQPTGLAGMVDENPHVQGVDEENKKIYVGNTAATTGAFATVGVPFNAGLNAALYAYNLAGGFNGYSVELIHYDDGFDGATGLSYTEKLVEEDEVFALVGHFGTNTVEATLDYIEDTGVPMVYAATGVSGLFNAKAEGNQRAIMSVQPIYDAEGEVLLARAAAAVEGNMGLGGSKIGVISTTDAAGLGMLNGIKNEAAKLGIDNITYVETSADKETNHSTAVTVLKNAGCDVVIIAANQTPFQSIMTYFNTTGYENVKVITSYVSANATLAGTMIGDGSVTSTREAYTTAWLDITSSTYFYAPEATNATGTYLWNCYKALVADTYPTFYDAGVPGFSEEYWTAAEAICAYELSLADYTNAFLYSFDSYALAGYIAGFMFIQGLERLEAAEVELTWGNYYNAMEIEEVDVPMGGSVNFGNGRRAGIQDLAVNKFGTNALTGAGELQVFSSITKLADVEAAVK